ncbi:putative cytochrome c like protein [Bradyrhizobium sp. ORS 278]|uniref:c-type cytochrome n=1 Tax=Bradyrhizobium sp. (strain ORS 278) TaxID=114615 RepID=UPI00015085C8|nr:cytochrome c [Bradyrhizobium sp. ORS 278]CAL79157.1 putative cytochrome c like protein [Bradyrhizobium sp. ORS 278]
MFMRTAATFAAVVAISAALSAAAFAQQQDGEAAHSPIDLGKMTFAQKCSHCHGPNMVNSGTITPDLRRFPDDQPRFVTTVKQGKNGRMPPWGDILSDDEITALWAYVSSRRAQ